MRKKLTLYVSVAMAVGFVTTMPARAFAQELALEDMEAEAEIAYLRNQVSELQTREAEAKQRVEALEARLSRLEQMGMDPISTTDSTLR